MNCISVEETADLRITQNGQPLAELTVQKGKTYTFSVTNKAGFPHNFYIGPPDKLSTNAVAGLPGIPEFPSGTQTFEYTADQDGSLEFACSLPGHYPSMHGTLKVQP